MSAKHWLLCIVPLAVGMLGSMDATDQRNDTESVGGPTHIRRVMRQLRREMRDACPRGESKPMLA